jgi:hypothetical protein
MVVVTTDQMLATCGTGPLSRSSTSMAPSVRAVPPAGSGAPVAEGHLPVGGFHGRLRCVPAGIERVRWVR